MTYLLAYLLTYITCHTTKNAVAEAAIVQASQTYSWTKSLSGDEIANVNYNDIVNVPQNTIGSGYVLEYRLTKFSEIMQYNGHYAVQGHSRTPILVPIDDFL